MEAPIMVWRRWPDANGDLGVTLHFAEVEGRVECIGVDVRTFAWAGGPYPARKLPRPRAVTTSDLRSLRLAELIDKERANLNVFPTGDEELGSIPLADGQLAAWKPKRGRPPIYGPEHFARVARVYREAFARGRTPTRAVAMDFGVTPAAAAKWVARCRLLGSLPPTSQGKARSTESKLMTR